VFRPARKAMRNDGAQRRRQAARLATRLTGARQPGGIGARRQSWNGSAERREESGWRLARRDEVTWCGSEAVDGQPRQHVSHGQQHRHQHGIHGRQVGQQIAGDVAADAIGLDVGQVVMVQRRQQHTDREHGQAQPDQRAVGAWQLAGVGGGLFGGDVHCLVWGMVRAEYSIGLAVKPTVGGSAARNPRGASAVRHAREPTLARREREGWHCRNVKVGVTLAR